MSFHADTRSSSKVAIVRALPSPQSAKPIVQVTCGLIGASKEAAVQAAREAALIWLRDKQGITLPPGAWNGDSFETDFADGRPVAVESVDHVWALRYDHPDSTIPGRFWRTEVVTGWTDSRAMVGVRLSLIPGPGPAAWDRSVPRLVRTLVQNPGLSDYGYILSDNPWNISAVDDIVNLVALLENPHRTRPVYVLSEDANQQIAVDSSRLASRTAGIAHVVRIDAAAAYALADAIGDHFSVYNGAIRTYRPGFSVAASQFGDHPIATPEWIQRRFAASREFVELLVEQAIDASVSVRDLENRLPSFTRVRQFVAARRVQQARAGARSDKELAELYEKENQTLIEDRDAALQLSQELERSLENARSDADDLRGAIFRLKTRIAHLESALSSRSLTPIISYVDSYKLLGEWAARHVSGRLELLPRALRSAGDSQYSDIQLVQDALLLLATEYRNMRLGMIEREDFEDSAQLLGVQLSPSGDAARLMQFRDEYEVEWPRGKRALLDMHLKKGNDRDSRNCLRIYFFWDAESEQVVVGHLTDHLTNAAT